MAKLLPTINGIPGASANSKMAYQDHWQNTGWGIGYDAVIPKGKRYLPQGRVLSEDLELRNLARRQLTTSLRDLNRNFAIAAWMIRRHLDYVSTFHFRPTTGNEGLDKDLKQFMHWWSMPQNCDVGRRHSLPRLVRMFEMRRVIDGDVLINRLKDGRIQTIEGDRINNIGGVPYAELGIDINDVVNGVWFDRITGANRGYLVFKRMPMWTGLLWDRMVPARFSDLFGYFDRIDQIRGISPLTTAANSLRDCYEGFDYQLVGSKVRAFFAMVCSRSGSEELGTEELKQGEADPEVDPSKPRYDVDMGRGPVFLDLDPGDKLESVESKQPSTEFQSFSEMMIMVSLKALDIPYSFFNEAHSNYSGARMSGVQFYEAAVKPKQADVRMLLDKLTRWRLALAIIDGDIELPAGFKASQLSWEWDHAGIPLYDPYKEVSASIAAVNAGFSSTVREAKKLGLDAYTLIDEQAQIQDYATSKGVVLSTALASRTEDDPNKQSTITEDVDTVDTVKDADKSGGNSGKPNKNSNGNGNGRMAHLWR